MANISWYLTEWIGNAFIWPNLFIYWLILYFFLFCFFGVMTHSLNESIEEVHLKVLEESIIK